MTAPAQATTNSVIRALPAAQLDAAADVLADCLGGDRVTARARLDAAATEADTTLLAAWQGDDLVAAYVLEKIGFTNEVTAIAVAPAFRRRGIGRMCLYDALLRSGKRPLVIGVDEGTLPFVKAVGFKMVGRLERPDGSVRYRMGWHAPMPQPDGLARADAAAGRVERRLLTRSLPMHDQIDSLIALALAEDIGPGDITATTVVPAGTTVTGIVLAKEAGILSGLDAVARVFRAVDPEIVWDPAMADGDELAVGMTIGTVAGPARSVLTAERTALNLLQRLCGVATTTRRFVDAVAGTPARIVDTRKTTPGMRALEKAAVRHGGGANHRVGLYDGVLIKDNHLAAVGGDIDRAVRSARAGAPHTLRIEVEITGLAQLEPAIAAGADIVLLDNMDLATMREAVARAGGRVLLEASGGVRLATVRGIAETGVDLISVGAPTHSSPALDISLELDIGGV